MTLLRKYGPLVLGAVLIVAGAVLMLTQPFQDGWVAYAPLDGVGFVPPKTTRVSIGRIVLVSLGLAGASAWMCSLVRGDERSI